MREGKFISYVCVTDKFSITFSTMAGSAPSSKGEGDRKRVMAYRVAKKGWEEAKEIRERLLARGQGFGTVGSLGE